MDMRPLHEVEREHIERVVTAMGGDVYKAATVLQINTRTLYRRLHSFDYKLTGYARRRQGLLKVTYEQVSRTLGEDTSPAAKRKAAKALGVSYFTINARLREHRSIRDSTSRG